MRQLRILHFSDLHLGVETYGRVDPATGLSTRLLDYLAALDEVVDAAVSEPFDLVLFTGDAYKSRDPNPTHQRELARRIGRLAGSGVPVVLIVGNHDLPNSLVRAHSVEIFDTLAIQNIHVVSRIGLERIETRSGPVQVVGLPWILRGSLMRQDENKNLTVEQLHNRIVQQIHEAIARTAELIDADNPAILAAHCQVAGATFGSERNSTLGQDYLLSRPDLSPDSFDYIALGHIHAHQSPFEHPPAVYAGSLQRTDFGEEKEAKGYVVVDIEPAPSEFGGRPFRATWRFVPVKAARSFLTIKVDARTEKSDPTAFVVAAVEQRAADVAGAVVRLQIRLVAENEGLLRDGEIRRVLKDASFVAAVNREVDRPERRRLADDHVEQLSPHDALERFLLARDTPAGRRKTLLEFADRLISELDDKAFS